MNFWNNFAAKHPAAAKWVREGGLFVIVSNLITVFKYLLLQFLPRAFASLPVVDFGWPGIDITLFGETFKWNILGYDAAHGGLPYFCAYMVAMVIGECINFPIQRNFVFRSKGSLARQIGWYLLAFCLITCIVNSINCIWVAVAGLLVPDFIYNIAPRCSTAASRWSSSSSLTRSSSPKAKPQNNLSSSLFSSFSSSEPTGRPLPEDGLLAY